MRSAVGAGLLVASLAAGVAAVGLAAEAPRKKYFGTDRPPATFAPEPVKAGSDNCSAATPVATPLPYTDSGDTTGAVPNVQQISAACAAGFPYVPQGGAPGPDHVYQLQLAPGNYFTVTVSTPLATYDPMIYLLTTCASGSTCVIARDNCGAANLPILAGCTGSTETFTTSLPPGTYYLYIDSFYSAVSAPTKAQGPYTLEVAGTLPVELLRFEVE